MEQYKVLSSGKNIDVSLVDYIRQYKIDHPEMQVLIGCDSQNHKRDTMYAIVVGLYRPSKGAHVVYKRFSTPRERDTVTRLLNEVWHSVAVAEQLNQELNIHAEWIDIDLNRDEKFKSNQALRNAIGLVEGMGYKVRYKNSPTLDRLPLMTYAADSIVK